MNTKLVFQISIILLFLCIACGKKKENKISNSLFQIVPTTDTILLNEKSVEEIDVYSGEPLVNHILSNKDKKDMILFLEGFQSLVKTNNILAIADDVEFPLQGDCIYMTIWDDYFDNRAKYEGKINRTVFIKNFYKILKNSSLRLIKEMKINETLFEEEGISQDSKKDDSGRYDVLEIQVLGRNTFVLSVGRVDPVESLNEHSTAYYFTKISGKYKLFLINCAG